MSQPKEVPNQFTFTEKQQEEICNYYHVKRDELEFWEICELLDKFIDERTCATRD